MPWHGESDWPDGRLVEAIRSEPPSERALDVLVDRYWAALYARCRLLAQDDEHARDLAQDAWHRVLRARRTLDADGNFRGYLLTVATNLWRDRNRAERRAGPLADHRLASLDAPPSSGGDPASLADALPDPHSCDVEGRATLAADLDRALAGLSPRLRDVLLARYLDGESAAEIGRRYGRTEQSITTWLRQAAAELRAALGADYAVRRGRAGTRSPEARRRPTAGG